MIVLVVNAGSSTLKCQVIQTDGKLCLAKALAEKVGAPDASMVLKLAPAFAPVALDVAGRDVAGCLGVLLDALDALACPDGSLADASPAEGPQAGSLADNPLAGGLDAIEAVGNRIVSGGEYFSHATLIDDEAFEKIRRCEELAPLHNPPADACIELVRCRLPRIPQVAVFDTGFHQTMPPKAYMYPLPMRYYDQYRIRRYGAHGTSHRYAAQQAANLLGRPLKDLGLITCHLGSGGSIAAVNHGESIDTTMGFTPLEGLMMGTRSGSIDPAIVTYIMRREGIGFDEMDRILNKESGVLGISGTSADMRDVLQRAQEGDERAELAIQMYVYKVQKAIGSFFAVMTRTDAVVMTAGIGENSAELRERIFAGLAHMGMILDKEKNHVVGAVGINRVISIDDSPIKICVVTTDEEMRIARETDALVGELRAAAGV